MNIPGWLTLFFNLNSKNGPKILDWFEAMAISRPYTLPLEVWNLFLGQPLSPESSVTPSSIPHKEEPRHVRENIFLKNGAISCSFLNSFEKNFFQYLCGVFLGQQIVRMGTKWRSVRPQMPIRPLTITLKLILGTVVFSLFDLSVAN